MKIGMPPIAVISGITIDADIAMGTKKLTGLGAGSTSGHSLQYQQAILQALLTTRGDLLYRGASIAARLAKGTEGYILSQGANDPAWAAISTILNHVTGNYTGNNGNDRQITTGFVPNFVIIIGPNGLGSCLMLSTVALVLLAGGGFDIISTTAVGMHASDGFVVDNTNLYLNATGETYYYWAFKVP